MSQFVSKELVTIDLGDNEWVKIPKEISFAEVQKFAVGGENDVKVAMQAMVSLIKDWNLREDGKAVEITEENISRLKMSTINTISKAITELVGVDKKKAEDE